MNQNTKLTGLLKTLGPGLLFAGTAVGVSHLMQSTRAGANYGFALAWVVVITMFIKYPFFEFTQRYTAAMKENVFEGFRRIGKWALFLYFGLLIISATITISAVTTLTAVLSSYIGQLFFDFTVDISNMSIILLVIVLIVLHIGKYKFLDKLMKFMMVTLSILTVTAFIMAIAIGPQAQPDYIAPELLTVSGISFMIALMGWMPAPIEVSTFPSIWAIERMKETNYQPKLKESLFDFKVGYFSTLILAICFLGLGALIMYGTGNVYGDSNADFAMDFTHLYTDVLGSWSLPMIVIIALFTMLSTTFTVVDGYPRAFYESIIRLTTEKSRIVNLRLIITYIPIILSVGIIMIFETNMTVMIDLTTIIAFLMAPIFAYLNFKIVTSDWMPKEHRPSRWLRILSWIGIFYFISFSIFFIIFRFIIH